MGSTQAGGIPGEEVPVEAPDEVEGIRVRAQAMQHAEHSAAADDTEREENRQQASFLKPDLACRDTNSGGRCSRRAGRDPVEQTTIV